MVESDRPEFCEALCGARLTLSDQKWEPRQAWLCARCKALDGQGRLRMPAPRELEPTEAFQAITEAFRRQIDGARGRE